MLLESVALEITPCLCALSLSLPSAMTQQELSSMKTSQRFWRTLGMSVEMEAACTSCRPNPSWSFPGGSTLCPSPHPYSEALCGESPSTTPFYVEAQILAILHWLMETTLLPGIFPDHYAQLLSDSAVDSLSGSLTSFSDFFIYLSDLLLLYF